MANPIVFGAVTLAVCCSLMISRVAGAELVESRPIDGHQFSEGQTFRFVCKAVGSQEFAVRLLCPISQYAPTALMYTSCFENCGKPICNQPNLNNCGNTMPELANAECTRRISQLIDGTQELTFEYVFRTASVRNQGQYICQYKNMRSSVIIKVDATTTTTTSTTAPPTTARHTTTTTTTTTTPTTSTTTTPTTSTTTTATTTTKPKLKTFEPTKIPAWLPGGVQMPAETTPSTTAVTRLTVGTKSYPSIKTISGDPNAGLLPERVDNVGPTTWARDDEIQLKSGGWFYSSLVGKLVGIDIVLIVVLIILTLVLICGFLFIRCQVLARQQATASTKRPLQSCCTAVLCLGSDNIDGGNVKKSGNGGMGGGSGRSGYVSGAKKSNGHQPPKFLQSPERRPHLHAFPSVASDSASAQVYSEAGPGDSTTYSQGELESLNNPDAYYRLQTNFLEADPRLMAGGSQRGPRSGVGGGFFSREAPDRHSFHNVRAARQRPAIPAGLLVPAAPVVSNGGREFSHEEIHEQVEQQRREIEVLKQQLRDSQIQLSRLDSSQQNLHRSVSFSRMGARVPPAASSPGTAATTPDEQRDALADDYEFLTKTTTPTSTELPSFAATVPPAAGIGGVLGGLRASADLLLSIEEPIEEEEDPAEQVEYPTVRSSKRRSSIGEAYGAGRLCPA